MYTALKVLVFLLVVITSPLTGFIPSIIAGMVVLALMPE